MTLTRDMIVAEAREWVGTPFHWQQSVKRHGCDCKGLLVGVARELGMPEADALASLRMDYRKDFKAAVLLEGLKATLREVGFAEPGDILAMEVGARGTGPRHLGILTPGNRLVHCYGEGPLKKVIEVPVGRSRRIHSFWTWPSLGATNGG